MLPRLSRVAIALAIVASLFVPLVSKAQSPLVHIQSGNMGQVVRTTYENPRSARLLPISSQLQSIRLLEGIAQPLSMAVKWPVPLSLKVAECGVVNAKYIPRTREILLCWELLERLLVRANQDFGRSNTQEQIVSIWIGALLGVSLHEVGHAMIDIFSPPVLGREEDVADQIAVYIMLNQFGATSPLLVGGFHWFFKEPQQLTSLTFANEHSINAVRQFDIVCWAYGSSPEKFSNFANSAGLPRERAIRCSDEYGKLARSMRQLFASHLYY